MEVTWRRPEEDTECTIPHVHFDQTDLGDTTNWSEVEAEARQAQLILMQLRNSSHSPVGQWVAGGFHQTEECGLSEKQEKLERSDSQRFQNTHILKDPETSPVSASWQKCSKRLSSRLGCFVRAEGLLSQLSVCSKPINLSSLTYSDIQVSLGIFLKIWGVFNISRANGLV